LPAAVLAVVSAAVAAQLATGRVFPTAEGAQRPGVVVVTPAQWTDKIWRTFSCYRSNMEGDRREPITVQWTATAEQIRTQLESRGWSEGSQLSARSLLSLVSPNVTATALPVLPKLNNGEPSRLEFVRSHAGADERDVLRFWPTQYAVERQDGAPATPIWLGSLVHERLRRPSWPFNVLRPTKVVEPMISEYGESSPWRDIEVARSTSCEGVRVALIASRAQ
jgi:undecaprenyl-diphosphatase